jgi:flagellar basal-body rod modification protein FlgD
MSVIQDSVSVSELLTSNSGSIQTTARKSDEDMQERFLKLLVTQIQNQDPLSPMDNAEVTSQMAQISTVSGIDKLNSTLEKLVAGSDARRSFEAATMIGRSVLVPGKDMQLESHTGIGGFELPKPADKLVVTIKDNAGLTVREIDLGAQAAGVGTFTWDGLANNGNAAADGQYNFVLKAIRDGKEVSASTLAFGSVSSAQAGKDGALLEVDKLGYVGLDNIKKIF